MTDPAHQQGNAGERSVKSAFSKYVTLLVAVVAFIAACAGIGSFYLDFLDRQEPQSAPSAVTPATAGNRSLPSAAAAAAGGGALRSGTCVTDAGQPTGCDGVHFGEVFATDGNCSQQALVAYTGGVFTVDVLRSDLVTIQSGQPAACTVVLPPELAAAGPLQDRLRQDGHEALRQCQNRFAAREVPCDQLHTAEVVYANPDHGAGAAGCTTRADEYMGGSLARSAQKLDILTTTSAASLVCSVQAKGDNQLAGSVRNLGTTALPVRPLD